MNDPDYKIRFNPVNRPKGFGFDVEVSDEFVEFARRQEINKKSYEDAAENAYKLFGLEASVEDYKKRGFCHWDGDSGLLNRVEVPGSAAGICLEYFETDGWTYYPHNIDSPNQTLVLFAVMMKYIYDISSSIELENARALIRK